MSERSPRCDPTQAAIANVLHTLQSEAAALEPNGEPTSEAQTVAPVDFDSHARALVAGGLFTEHPRPPGLNSYERQWMPDRPLGRPWSSASFFLTDGLDIPASALNTARRFTSEASRAIFKPDLVAAFVDECIASDDIFWGVPVRDTLAEFVPGEITYEANPNKDLSFRTDGVNRKVNNRRIYTKAEGEAGLDLMHEQPELVLTIATYQAMMVKYVQNIKASLESQGLFDERGRQEFEAYLKGWEESNNFFISLIPGIAVFLKQAQERHPDMPVDELVNGPLFSHMFMFGLRSGMFRDHIEVDEAHAYDGVAHEARLRCPLAGTIADHLSDGELFDRIHQKILAQKNEGHGLIESSALSVRAKIDAERSQEIWRQEQLLAEEAERAKPFEEFEVGEDMDLYGALGHAVFMADQARKPAKFTLNGTEYTIEPGRMGSMDDWAGEPQDSDYIEERGSYLPGRIVDAASHALRTNQTVAFQHNFTWFRITPERARSMFSDIPL